MSKNRILEYIKKHRKHFLFCLYLGTVINIYIYLKLAPTETSIYYNLFLIFLFLIIYCISYAISLIVGKIINKINIVPSNKQLTTSKKITVFFVVFALCMSIGILWFIAYCPGGFTADSIEQYTQATTNSYNDWHPVLHTLLFFKLPLTIFNTPQSIVLCQLILFSLVIAYTTITIYSIAGRKWSLLFLLIILINPIIFDELMAPWKDVGFAILALLSTTIIFKKYYNPKPNKHEVIHIIMFGLLLSICTLLRHNGFLFTVPTILAIYFLLSKKQWLILLGTFLITIFLIKVPLYSILEVEAPDKRTVEIVGLPLTVMANVAKYSPQSLDEDTSNYLYQIAPPETWENSYYTGDFNSIKFNGANLSAIENLNPVQITLLTAKTIVRSPALSSLALFKLTHVVYGLGDIPSYSVTPQIHPNNKANISYNGNQKLANITNAYRTIYSQSILKYTSYCGFTICIILAFIIFKGSRKKWQKILLCIPILIYDFGTMLLLSGPETRFFYINFLLYPAIFILFSTQSPFTKTASKHLRRHKK